MSTRIKSIFILLLGVLFIIGVFYAMEKGKMLRARIANAATVVKVVHQFSPAVVDVPVLKPTGTEKVAVPIPNIAPGVYKIKYDEAGWIALNMYHEARGEGPVGMLAVGEVTLNRLRSGKYPKTIYSVISQPAQFSWYNSKKHNRIAEPERFHEAVILANKLVKGEVKVDVVNKDVLWYHAEKVNPKWAKEMTLYAQIGRHKYYTM